MNAGSRRLPHTRVYTITDVVKVIHGVPSVAVLDQDIDGGQIVEEAIDYLSIDAHGTVWYRGSYTEGFEGGQLPERPGRLAGRAAGRQGGRRDACPSARGNALRTSRHRSRRRGDAGPGVKTGQTKCVPFSCYKNVVVILEGGAEYKYFAPGVGGIKTGQPLVRRPGRDREPDQRHAARRARDGRDQRRDARSSTGMRAHDAPRSSALRRPPCGSPERASPPGPAPVLVRVDGRLEDVSRGRGRDAVSCTGSRPRTARRRDDQPRRGVGQREVDADLGARRADAARAGTVVFDGQDITALDDAERARLRAERIGVVLQRGN